MEKHEKELMDAYEAYADNIYRHCFFRVFSEQRAEELVQETFMRVWQYLQKQESAEIENMRAFLYRIANNLIIDDSRKKKSVSLEQVLEADPSQEPATDATRSVERQVLLAQVEEALDKLPKDTSELLRFRYIEGLEPREIADLLGISSGAVSVRLNRAAKLLKEVINPSSNSPSSFGI